MSSEEIAKKQKERRPQYLFDTEFKPSFAGMEEEKYSIFCKQYYSYFLKGYESRQIEIDDYRSQIHDKNVIIEGLKTSSEQLLAHHKDVTEIEEGLQSLSHLKAKFLSAVEHLKAVIEENKYLQQEIHRMEQKRRQAPTTKKAKK